MFGSAPASTLRAMTRSTVLSQVNGEPAPEWDPPVWLAHWLSHEARSVLDSLVPQLIRELPEIAAARTDPQAHVREAIRAHLEALDGGLRSGEPAEIRMPSIIDRYTRALARHGTIALPVLLRSFEQIHAELWRQLVHALRDGPYELPAVRRAAVLEHASVHLFDYFRTASNQTAAAYATERALLDRRATSRQAEVVAAVVAGSVDGPSAERVLSYDFNTVHVGYVAWVDNLPALARLDGFVLALTDQIRPRRHLSVPAGDRSVHGWLDCRGDHWRRIARQERLPEGIHLAWGGSHEGIDGFRASHFDALEARRIGEALGARGSVLFDDVAVSSLASRDLAAASAFVRRQLGMLATTTESSVRLLDTLRVYLDELASPTRTARRLHVHPNTVVKRVERIEALLGRPVDPASLGLRVAVELAPLVGASSH